MKLKLFDGKSDAQTAGIIFAIIIVVIVILVAIAAVIANKPEADLNAINISVGEGVGFSNAGYRQTSGRRMRNPARI